MQDLISAGAGFDFGTVVFSEQDIIDYALKNDPLDFHVDLKRAKEHMFKNLVASGQHAFHHFYTKHWIPKFGKTVLCGLSLNHWVFEKPIYAGQDIHCHASIIKIVNHPEKNSQTVQWKFDFTNAKGVHYQHLEMKVLHSKP